MTKLAVHGGKPVRNEFLPAFRALIGESEINEVIDTLKSDWLTMGPKTRMFEEMFREYIGCEHAIAVSSCTAGLHLSLASAGIGDGDEVITSPYTFTSTANVIVHQRARPVFVDVEKDTYNIDTDKIDDVVSRKTKAIIPVHYAGQPCEMDRIVEISKKYGLVIIEDAAHAIGASYKNRKIGTIGDLTSFSFYATKNITTGDGGMVVTDNDELAEKIRALRLHGMSRDAWKRYTAKGSWFYEILYPGYKYNMTDIQASLGIHQLKKLDVMQKRREEMAAIYNEAFADMHEIIIPKVKDDIKHAWHLYAIQINKDSLTIDRSQFIEILRAENIGTSVHFIPLHLHPYYRNRYGFKRGDFANAELLYESEISLPLYPKMTNDDVGDVIEAVQKIVDQYRI